jgi:hypothetical protein
MLHLFVVIKHNLNHPIESFVFLLYRLHLGLKSDMEKYAIGEFEEVVMLTVAVLYKNAYGIAIKEEIEHRLKRKVSVGAMRTALKRWKTKGSLPRSLVKQQPSEVEKESGISGNTIRKEALEQIMLNRIHLWEAIPPMAFGLK